MTKRLTEKEVIEMIATNLEYAELRQAAKEAYLKVNSANLDNLVGVGKNNPDITPECNKFRRLFVGINHELPTSNKLLYNEIILPIFLPKVAKD